MGSLQRVSISETHTKSLLSVSHDPHPRDFERFIPWVSRQFNMTNVTVNRLSKAEYQPVQPALKNHKTPVKNASGGFHGQDLGKTDSIASSKEYMRMLSSPINLADAVIISAYHDTNSVLVEIAFIDCLVPVPKEVFKLIQLCLPHHPHLTRITWKGERLTSILLHEISKIIPGSEITDVIFDDCYVPQGNYYLLLDKATNLKYLSLTNCEINDEVCAMIAERIQRDRPAAENLLVLNLSSNRITDVGAEALGRSLRTNRRLLYLNLCNNDLTSVGAAHLLSPLTKFKLSPDENRDMQLLKLKSAGEKFANNKYLKDIKNLNANEYFERKQEIEEQKLKLKKKKAHSHFDGSVNETQMSDTSVIIDIYLATVKEKKGAWYSSGNMTLCALNLAYNRLDSATVSRIVDVVLYQYRRHNKCSKTGLLRVVIEGNPLPKTCMEYDLISKYIDLAIAHSTPKTHSIHMHLSRSKTKTSRSETRSEHRMK